MHLVTWLFGLCRAWLPDGSRPAPAHLRALRADLALRFRDPSGGAAARVLRALDALGHAVVVAPETVDGERVVVVRTAGGRGRARRAARARRRVRARRGPFVDARAAGARARGSTVLAVPRAARGRRRRRVVRRVGRVPPTLLVARPARPK